MRSLLLLPVVVAVFAGLFPLRSFAAGCKTEGCTCGAPPPSPNLMAHTSPNSVPDTSTVAVTCETTGAEMSCGQDPKVLYKLTCECSSNKCGTKKKPHANCAAIAASFPSNCNGNSVCTGTGLCGSGPNGPTCASNCVPCLSSQYCSGPTNVGGIWISQCKNR